MNNIPLIIPNFNQLTYLKNLINWWRWYYPNNPIHIIDNGSDYKPLSEFYKSLDETIYVAMPGENDCVTNLKDYLFQFDFEYYVISDPDIMPHPSTPPNFLEVFKAAIDQGYHRAGFDLITHDLPDWLHNKATVIENEKLAGQIPVNIDYNGIWYNGRQAAIDTTFCMYTNKNSGWHSPMDGKDWPNAVRLFRAYHLGWYLHPDFINEEMDHYYKTCRRHDYVSPPAGKNNYRPVKYD